MTFGQAIERYLQDKSRKITVTRDRSYLRALAEAFGTSTPLADITASRISAWKAERLAATCLRTRGPYAAATINRPLQALRTVLHLAHDEWEELQAIPRIRLEKEPEGRIRYLAPEEEARLLDACRATTPDLATIVTVAMETGMRKGELFKLTWDRVDLSRGVILLEGTPRRSDDARTKSGRRRDVPMRQKVYEILAARPSPREGRVWPRVGAIDKAFHRAVRTARVHDFTFHDIRHHFASWFMMTGGDLYALSKILGHRKVAMTEKYAHLAPDHLRAQMAQTERTDAAEVSIPNGIHNAVMTSDSNLR